MAAWAACFGVQLKTYYTVFHKKGPLFVFLIIHANDDQFTQKFLPVVAEETLI